MMDEDISDTMNLDLNLGPAPEPASSSALNESVHIDDRLEEPRHRLREAYRLRTRQRWRWRQVQIPAETQNISVSFNQMLVVENSVEGSSTQAGEGSVTAEGRTRTRTSEEPKSCDMNNANLVDEEAKKKDDFEEVNGSDGSFFDCNICLELARDPVVTCCGHLFCWPCLYSWLHLHSEAKECPVCKGEVTIKNVTPIYGRGNNGRELEEGSTLKVPQRPQGRRIESLRQTIQRAAFNLPVEEMLRQIGSRFEPNREIIPPLEPDGAPESLLDQSQTLLNRILASNRMQREQTPVVPAEEADLILSDVHGPEARGNRIVRRGRQAFRITMPSVTSSGLSLGTDAYIVRGSRNYDQGQGVDERDSFSSIAAVINSESQMDTNMEIDSTVSLSTSSSRRNDASRISDMDSGDSRSHRRRRLN